MKLYYNKVTDILSLAPLGTTNIARIQRKRYSTLNVELIPTNEAGAVELFDPATVGVLVVKTKGAYTGDAKLLDTVWEVPVAEGRGYTFSVVLAGNALDGVLGTLEKLGLALEMTWSDGTSRGITPTVDLEVWNNYWREGDPAPPDPEVPFPLPAEILTKTGNLAGLADKAAARGNLDISVGALINKVAVPADSAAAGQPGDFAISADYLFLYTGTGLVHAWLRFAGANEF